MTFDIGVNLRVLGGLMELSRVTWGSLEAVLSQFWSSFWALELSWSTVGAILDAKRTAGNLFTSQGGPESIIFEEVLDTLLSS